MTSQLFMPSPSDHVLVASPNPAVRQRVLEGLRSPVQRVEEASGGAEALGYLESGSWHVLFLDRSIPDLDVEELSATVRSRFPDTEVVFLEPDGGDGETATFEEVAIPPPMVKSSCSNRDETAVDQAVHAPLPGMIGNSLQMQPVYRASRLLARRNTTVLISGPTGSGKELVARGIHSLSPRARKAFVVINCAAIPEALLESELFGHTRCVEPGLKTALSEEGTVHEQASRAGLYGSAIRCRAGARSDGAASPGSLYRTADS